jgi:hypothetical protein
MMLSAELFSHTNKTFTAEARPLNGQAHHNFSPSRSAMEISLLCLFLQHADGRTH